MRLVKVKKNIAIQLSESLQRGKIRNAKRERIVGNDERLQTCEVVQLRRDSTGETCAT